MTLPPFRYCPRCGASDPVLRGNRSIACPACGFTYFFNTAAAVTALIENDRREILLTIRAHDPAKGTLDLPGGFVDPGESAEAALAREIREELNLAVTGLDYYGSFPNAYPWGDFTVFTLDLAFRCRIEDFSPLRPADDVAGAVFLPPADIDPARIGLASTREILKRFCGAT